MAITSFTFDRSLTDAFIRFGYDVYASDIRWIPPFRNDMDRQLSPAFPFYRKPGNAHRHFLALSGRRVVGRVSAMINADMRHDQEDPPGLLGFFECVEDPAVCRDLLEAACGWLVAEHGVPRVIGPMNFDIWHGYRFMTRGFERELFVGEPYNKTYYPGYFESAGFCLKRRWHSVEIVGRGLIESLAARGAETFEKLLGQGYRFEGFDVRRFGQELMRLHGLVMETFGGFPDFTLIPPEEFVALFAGSRLALNPRLTLFFSDDAGRTAGFAVALLELSEAVRAMKGKKDLFSRLQFLARRPSHRRVNLYAGGITPMESAKRSGLGRAGFSCILRRVLDLGYKEMLVTLISEDNKSNGFLGPLAKDYGREYALYELKP